MSNSPGAVRTNFGTSSRNRPEWAGPATIVADGIRSRRFYRLTSENRNAAVLRRGEEIVAGGPPELPVSFVN